MSSVYLLCRIIYVYIFNILRWKKFTCAMSPVLYNNFFSFQFLEFMQNKSGRSAVLAHIGTQTGMDNDPSTVCAVETPTPTSSPIVDPSSRSGPHLPSDPQACVDQVLIYALSHNGSIVRELQQSDTDMRQELAWLVEGQRPPRWR